MSERDLTSAYENALDDLEVALGLFVQIDWPSGPEYSVTLSNADFETGTLSGWASIGTPTVGTTSAIAGTYSVLLDEGGGGTGDRIDSDYFPVVQGEVFRLTAVFKRNASDLPANSCQLVLRYLDSTGSFVAFGTVANAVAATSGNQTVSVTDTVPANARSVAVVIAASNAGTGSWYVDSVTIERLQQVGRFWSGIGTVLWNSLPWYGIGTLGTIDKLAESIEKTDNGVELTLNYLDDEIRNEVNTNDPIGSDASIFLNVMSIATGLVTESKEVFTGFVDRVEIEDAGVTGSIKVRLAHESARLKQARFYALSDAHQQFLFAGDKGMEFATHMDEPISWGRYPFPVYVPGTPSVPPSTEPYPGYNDQYLFPLPGQ